MNILRRFQGREEDAILFRPAPDANEHRRNARSLVLLGAAVGAAAALLTAFVTVQASKWLQQTAAATAEVSRIITIPVLKKSALHPLSGNLRHDDHAKFWRTYEAVASQAGTDPGNVHIKNSPDDLLFSAIGLGQPPQPFVVMLDFQASNLWVPSSECHNYYRDSRKYRFYERSSSSTHQGSSYKVDLKYPKGGCSGVLAVDTLQLGNASIPSVPFLQTLFMSKGYANSEFDGVLGLGLPAAANPSGLKTPLLAVLNSHQASLPDFVFHLNMSDETSGQGMLTIGTVPMFKYPAGIKWINILNHPGSQLHGQWAISIDEVSFGQGSNPKFGRVGIVDPGTTCIVIPSADARHFFDLAREASLNDARCKAMPTLHFTINEEHYLLSGDDYGSQQFGHCEVCVLGSMGSVYILGQTFQRKYSATFDFGHTPPRVGLPQGEMRATYKLLRLIAIIAMTAAAVATISWTARKVRRQTMIRRVTTLIAAEQSTNQAATQNQS